ncbi:helix-turn-helix transcriptional regulator [Staphylococcus nepalensis]|nr:helix-turn-helix transcriptional regulator [Staphylococcus nepalensis]
MIICTLNKLMEENDKTQSEVANATGITRPTLLSLIRNDNQSIRYETINQLCNFFDIDMSELLVYSPVDVKLKNILLEEVPMTTKFESTDEKTCFAVSLIYDINGIELEFDTNLGATKTGNSLKNSGKFFFNSLIYENELKSLETNGFKKDFVKTYNNSINVEGLIKDKLEDANLNTNFKINHYEVGIQAIKNRGNEENVFEDLVEELKSLVESIPFEDEEKKKMFKKISDIKHISNKGD